MKAIESTGTDDPLVYLAEADEPLPGPGEALIRIHAIGLNRSDLNRARTRGAGWRLGIDAAGVVEQPAANGEGPPTGQRVVAYAPAGGLAAELAAVPARQLVPLPDAIDLHDAATLPLAGLVALRLVRQAQPLTGRSVLMTGATGGVGQFLAQLATAEDARVTVLTPAGRGRGHLAQPGVQVIHDLDDSHGPFDIVYESVGGDTGSHAITRVARDGLVLWYGQASGQPVTLDFFGFIGAHQSFTLRHYVIDNDPDQDTRDLSTLVNAVTAGELRPVIGHTAPSRDAAAALAGLAERTTFGKTILTVGLT